MMFNEQSLAIYEAETALAEKRWEWQLEEFYRLAESEGWDSDETAIQYQAFENDPDDFFREW